VKTQYTICSLLILLTVLSSCEIGFFLKHRLISYEIKNKVKLAKNISGNVVIFDKDSLVLIVAQDDLTKLCKQEIAKGDAPNLEVLRNFLDDNDKDSIRINGQYSRLPVTRTYTNYERMTVDTIDSISGNIDWDNNQNVVVRALDRNLYELFRKGKGMIQTDMPDEKIKYVIVKHTSNRRKGGRSFILLPNEEVILKGGGWAMF